DDDLPPVLVGDADDDDVADRRVLQQRVLDLGRVDVDAAGDDEVGAAVAHVEPAVLVEVPEVAGRVDRKSTRLNSSHVNISYAVSALLRSSPTRRSSDLDDDLPPVLVGDADDDDVADRRVLQQRVLDLGRVDVDAAGDDEVGAAVAHVEPAVLVEVPEVAGRVEVAAHGGRGLLRVPVVLETGLPARVDQAGLPRRQLRAVRVEDLDLDAVDRAPHGAGAGEPLLGGGDDDRSALGGAVV